MAWRIFDRYGNERQVAWLRGETTDNGTVVTGNRAYTNARNHVYPDLEYNGSWMGECFVTLSIRCAVPIDFEIGDYVEYRGEKFVVVLTARGSPTTM